MKPRPKGPLYQTAPHSASPSWKDRWRHQPGSDWTQCFQLLPGEHTTNSWLPKTFTYKSQWLAVVGWGPIQCQVFFQNSKKEIFFDADGSKTYERYLPSFIIRECKLKHADIFRLWKTRIIENIFAEDVGNWIFSYFISGNVNWYNAYRGTIWHI